MNPRPSRKWMPLLFSLSWLAAVGNVAAQGMTHDMTMGGVDSGNIGPNQTWTHTFSEAGTFSYHCHPHPFMTAQITISATDPSARSGMVDVRIQNYSFQPATLVIRPGTMVRWTNNDTVTHTVTQEVPDRGFTLFGLPWWQAALAGVALAAGIGLIFLRPKGKPPPAR